MKKILFLMFLVTSLFSSEFRPLTLDQACQFAKKNDKLILVYFEQENWKPCRLMRNITWDDANVKKWLNRCIPITSSKEKNFDLIKEYNVQNFPTMLILNKNRKILHTMEGYIAPKEFLTQVGIDVPSIDISVEGHHSAYLGKRTKSKIIIKNGAIALNNVNFNLNVPDEIKLTNFQFSKVILPVESEVVKSGGNKKIIDPAYSVSKLAPYEQVEFEFLMVSMFRGKHCISLNMTNEMISKAFQYCTTWRGFPSLLLEMIDSEDPVLIGETTTYHISISN